jgi:DNA ligase-1
MLGKTFKGLTDTMLAWQTERLLELEERRTRGTVWVRPELVVEIAFDGLQTSRRYPGGVALRFARVLRHRPDKRAEEADTLEAALSLATGQTGRAGSGRVTRPSATAQSIVFANVSSTGV